MHELYVGCGGWQYFQVSGPKLPQYASIFNFVEINRTFYAIPSKEQYMSWKRAIKGKPFRFAVKCNRRITHDLLLEPEEENFVLMKEMNKVCNTLDAIALVFQTPQFKLTSSKLSRIDEFFEQVHQGDLQLVWELRGDLSSTSLQVQDALIKLLIKHEITHCVDFSKPRQPIHVSSLGYSRIFGKGKKNMWQFSDPEIIQIDKRAQVLLKDIPVALSFHTMRMEIDAARLKAYHQDLTLLPTSTSIGIKAFMERIEEFDHFPIAKRELLEAHGWKIFDLTKKIRPRMVQILDQLPNKTYESHKAIQKEVRKIIPASTGYQEI